MAQTRKAQHIPGVFTKSFKVSSSDPQPTYWQGLPTVSVHLKFDNFFRQSSLPIPISSQRSPRGCPSAAWEGGGGGGVGGRTADIKESEGENTPSEGDITSETPLNNDCASIPRDNDATEAAEDELADKN